MAATVAGLAPLPDDLDGGPRERMAAFMPRLFAGPHVVDEVRAMLALPPVDASVDDLVALVDGARTA